MMRLRSLHLPLRARMALLMMAVVAAVGLAIRLFIEHRLINDMRRDLQSRAISLARNLAAEAVDPILYQDLVSLERLLTRAQQAWDDFEYAFVLDPTRVVLGHTFVGDFPEELGRLNRYRDNGEPQVQRIHVLGIYYRDVAVPVYEGQLGVLHLGFRDGSISRRVDALRRDITFLLALVATASGMVTFFTIWRATRPLDSIVAALESFRPGRFRSEIPVARDDEVGRLARRVNDITLGLHQAQLALDRENRLATLGRFASVIAHEVGNPLASIMTRLELMERCDEERFLRESLPLVRGQLGRIQNFLRGLSSVSKGGQPGTTVCRVNEVIHEVVDVLRYDPSASSMQVRTEPAELQSARCERDHLYQVVLNLGLNALRAAEPTGTVIFSTRAIDEAVLIEVSDNGPGVPEELRERIFDPFFSTDTEGTGLGLTISRDLLRKQGGDLRLVPRDGQGACFQVRLPYAECSCSDSAGERETT